MDGGREGVRDRETGLEDPLRKVRTGTSAFLVECGRTHIFIEFTIIICLLFLATACGKGTAWDTQVRNLGSGLTVRPIFAVNGCLS